MQGKRKDSMYRKLACGVLAVGLVAVTAESFAYASEFGLLSDAVSSSVYVTDDVYGSIKEVSAGTDGSASGTVTPTTTTTSDGDTDYYGYVLYTPTQTGYYSVASTNSADDVRIRVREQETGELVAKGSGYGAQATGLLEKGCTYYLAFAFYDSDNDEFESRSGSIGYTVSMLSAQSATFDKTYTNKVTAPGGCVLYRITVTEKAKYRFIAKGSGYKAYVYLYDSSWNYRGGEVSTLGRTLTAGTYYVATSFRSVKVTGSYTFSVHQCADLTGAKVVTTKKSYAYTGDEIEPSVKVTLNGATVSEKDYYVDYYTRNVRPGTAKVWVYDYYGNELVGKFTITKAANTLVAKAKSKAIVVKGKTKNNVLKKNVTFAKNKLFKVKKAKGKVTFARGAVKLGGKKVTGAQLKKIVVNKKTGKLTLKKGLKKGTYKVKVKVKAAGTSNYKAKTKTVTVTIKVK